MLQEVKKRLHKRGYREGAIHDPGPPGGAQAPGSTRLSEVTNALQQSYKHKSSDQRQLREGPEERGQFLGVFSE